MPPPNDFTTYRDPGSGGVTYPLATRDVTINTVAGRIARSIIGWITTGGVYHDASDSDPFPVGEAPFSTVVSTVGLLTPGSPTKLIATPLVGRRKVTLQNRGGETLDLGIDNSVAVGTGVWQVPPGGEFRETLGPGIDLWGISATLSLSLAIVELR